MKVKFYVIHSDSNIYTCYIILNEDGINTYKLGNLTKKKVDEENSKIVKLSGFQFHLFLNELQCCPQFHRNVARNFKSTPSNFAIQLIPNKTEVIDSEW